MESLGAAPVHKSSLSKNGGGIENAKNDIQNELE
jgi:hypothetical protein